MARLNIKNELIAFFGEFVGTCVFLFLGLGCIKTAQVAQTQAQTQTAVVLSNPTILFIATSMGLALLTTAWVFYRITGGLFNPAISFALYLIGALSPIRTVSLIIAQVAGGIAGAGLVACMTPAGGVALAITSLQPGTSIVQGLFLEALLTAILVFTVLMLAAEKHKATYLAPIGIGLVLFVCQLFGTLWTGCGMNPARALGPSVISQSFVSYHWIYHAGPFIGALIAVFIYLTLKTLDYGAVVLGQDSDKEAEGGGAVPLHKKIMMSKRMALPAHFGLSFSQRKAMRKTGMTEAQIGDVEAQLITDAAVNGPTPMVEAVVMSDGTLAPIEAQASDMTMVASRPVATRMMTSDKQNVGGIAAPGTHSLLGLGKSTSRNEQTQQLSDVYESPIANAGMAPAITNGIGGGAARV